VNLLNAVAAYNRLFEISLSSLIQTVPERAALLLALVLCPPDRGTHNRRRAAVSRDLHDQIGHDSVLIKLYLELIEMEHDQNKPGNVQLRIAEDISLVSQAIDSVWRLVFDLGPAVFDDLGFLPALRS
jgi:signal transduction histidine kinase